MPYRSRVLDQAPDSLIVDSEDGDLYYYDLDYSLSRGRIPGWYRLNHSASRPSVECGLDPQAGSPLYALGDWLLGDG